MSLQQKMSSFYDPIKSNFLAQELKDLAKELFFYVPLPQESTIYAVTRRIFETLGSLLIIASASFSIPLMTFGGFFYQLCRPTKNFHIYSQKHPLTQETIRLRLLSIIKNRFTFETIHIHQSTQFSQVKLSNIAIGILQYLHPKKITLWNIEIPEETILKSLENHKIYYTLEKGATSPPHYRLTQHKKIAKVVLSSNHTKMLQTLEKLALKEKKVACLYFTCLIPEELETRIAELTTIIDPTLQCYISHQKNLSDEQVATIFNA